MGSMVIMPKKPALFAYLIAVAQPDGSDHIYAILTDTMDAAIKAAAIREPGAGALRYAGSLGTRSVERMNLKADRVRLIGFSPSRDRPRSSNAASI
jgi:hypothetical protein